jgi:hypothetical protein
MYEADGESGFFMQEKREKRKGFSLSTSPE